MQLRTPGLLRRRPDQPPRHAPPPRSSSSTSRFAMATHPGRPEMPMTRGAPSGKFWSTVMCAPDCACRPLMVFGAFGARNADEAGRASGLRRRRSSGDELIVFFSGGGPRIRLFLTRSRRETQTTTRRDRVVVSECSGPIRSRAREGRSRLTISSRRISASLSPPHPPRRPCRSCRPRRFFSSPRDPRRSRSAGSRSFRAADELLKRYAPRRELGERQKAPAFSFSCVGKIPKHASRATRFGSRFDARRPNFRTV